mmetsp:Transcript_84962/g.214335  ORF Transcript_84962/g.214335 Transcript_84962/m.214335 type:complete len:215 (-) Transcript_84962:232-876(-)
MHALDTRRVQHGRQGEEGPQRARQRHLHCRLMEATQVPLLVIYVPQLRAQAPLGVYDALLDELLDDVLRLLAAGMCLLEALKQVQRAAVLQPLPLQLAHRAVAGQDLVASEVQHPCTRRRRLRFGASIRFPLRRPARGAQGADVEARLRFSGNVLRLQGPHQGQQLVHGGPGHEWDVHVEALGEGLAVEEQTETHEKPSGDHHAERQSKPSWQA